MMMDRQAIFNTAYLGLAGQGFRKSKKRWDPAYRGDGGLKCAIGHCIPEERYLLDFEGWSALHRPVLRALGFDESDLPNEDRVFIKKLQTAHDVADYQFPMRDRLHAFADEYGLTIPDLLEQG